MKVRFGQSRINRMQHVAAFRAAWDQPAHDYNHGEIRIVGTAAGNLNSTGTPGNYLAPAVPRHHEQFLSCIEPGVREFVVFFASELGWTTYTSCQGHSYDDAALRPVELHVGLLPRDEAEHAAMVASLRGLVRSFNVRALLQPVRMELLIHTLTSGDAVIPAVDVYLARRFLAPWPAYFEALSRSSALALRLARERLLSVRRQGTG